MKPLKITKQITQRDELLNRYLQDIGKEELITADEEVKLVQKIKQGDEIALEHLAKTNLRFVVSVAKQYQNQGLSLPDLINEGNLGLIKAAKRFDETRGFKFISYAVWWIRQTILAALAEQSSTASKKAHYVQIQNKVKKIIERFEQENEREPTVDEVTEALSETMTIAWETIREHVQRAMSPQKAFRYDAPLGDEEGTNSYDITPQNVFSSPDEPILENGEQSRFWEFTLQVLEKAKNEYSGPSTLPDLSAQEYLEIFLQHGDKVSLAKIRDDFEITQAAMEKIIRFTKVTLQNSEVFKKEARAHGGRF
jgi:RNA polymerase primary sigma factor